MLCDGLSQDERGDEGGGDEQQDTGRQPGRRREEGVEGTVPLVGAVEGEEEGGLENDGDVQQGEG